MGWNANNISVCIEYDFIIDNFLYMEDTYRDWLGNNLLRVSGFQINHESMTMVVSIVQYIKPLADCTEMTALHYDQPKECSYINFHSHFRIGNIPGAGFEFRGLFHVSLEIWLRWSGFAWRVHATYPRDQSSCIRPHTQISFACLRAFVLLP